MINKLKFHIFTLLLEISTLRLASSVAIPRRNIHYQRHQGRRLPGFYKELSVRSVFACCVQCGSDSQCAAANFKESNRKCELSSDTFGTGSQEANSEWEVLDKQEWHALGDSEYRLVDSLHSWDDAKAICESYNAYLTDINSTEETVFIETFADSQVEPFWVGGKQNTEVWEWLSGTPLTTPYDNWGSDEPNGEPRSELCMTIYQGFWNDRKCFREYRSVCKRP